FPRLVRVVGEEDVGVSRQARRAVATGLGGAGEVLLRELAFETQETDTQAARHAGALRAAVAGPDRERTLHGRRHRAVAVEERTDLLDPGARRRPPMLVVGA